MLTLTQFDGDDTCVSVTEHATLGEALAEHGGWTKTGAAVRYLVQGTMTLDCACKRAMESRNRKITMSLRAPAQVHIDSKETSELCFTVELKAPQACKLLQHMQTSSNDNYGTSATHEGVRTEPLIEVSITNDTFHIG